MSQSRMASWPPEAIVGILEATVPERDDAFPASLALWLAGAMHHVEQGREHGLIDATTPLLEAFTTSSPRSCCGRQIQELVGSPSCGSGLRQRHTTSRTACRLILQHWTRIRSFRLTTTGGEVGPILASIEGRTCIVDGYVTATPNRSASPCRDMSSSTAAIARSRRSWITS